MIPLEITSDGELTDDAVVALAELLLSIVDAEAAEQSEDAA